MAMTYVDGNIWNDQEKGFYFEVKEAKIASDSEGNKIAILDVVYDMNENAEVTTYRRRAYRDANSITGYFTVVNGLKIALKYELNVNGYTRLSRYARTSDGTSTSPTVCSRSTSLQAS